jgi:Sec7-like guanine-nucleotide exchange factor
LFTWHSSEPIYASALKAYLSSFDFSDDPIDIALRKLLMELYLPKETQQIDRVMEAFAQRYHDCNPRLFTTSGEQVIDRALIMDGSRSTDAAC